MGTSDRRPHLTATVLDQAYLDDAQDNLEDRLETVVDIDGPEGMIYASDFNKYVSGTFYEALTTFPTITRTMGEWLSPEVEFSGVELELSNVDGRFNNLLQGGADFDGWIGRTVEIKTGLRDVGATYTTLFKGVIHDQGGLNRSRLSVGFEARDQLDKLNVSFPKAVFNDTVFPNIEEDLIGVVAPVIYGDWTTSLQNVKTIPDDPDSPTATVGLVQAFAVNGNDPDVIAGTQNIQFIVSENDNAFLNTSEIYLFRGSNYTLIESLDVVNVVNNRQFEIRQKDSGGVTQIDGATADLVYANGDQFLVKVKGKDLGAYDDNIVSQARDILETFAGAVTGDFDSNWNTFRDKVNVGNPENNISTVKSRIWKQEPEEAVKFALSMLEQVRLEMFISRDLKLKLSSLHFDDLGTKWNSGAPEFTIKNWDVETSSFTPRLDDRNVWNRVGADYNFNPLKNEQIFSTKIFRNQAAITQMGREISKKIVFPNLYIAVDVENNLKEMLKLASSATEYISVNLTSRAFLRDLSEVARMDVNFGASVLEGVPVLFREIGFDPQGPKITAKLWSFQMIPFDGYSPSYAGIVGGSSATITSE